MYHADFTINTLALQVSPKLDEFLDLNCALYDFPASNDARPFTSMKYLFNTTDEERGCIRILHPLSFIDDPTRIYRALRFAIRFNYIVSKSRYQGIHRLSSNMLPRHGTRNNLGPSLFFYFCSCS